MFPQWTLFLCRILVWMAFKLFLLSVSSALSIVQQSITFWRSASSPTTQFPAWTASPLLDPKTTPHYLLLKFLDPVTSLASSLTVQIALIECFKFVTIVFWLSLTLHPHSLPLLLWPLTRALAVLHVRLQFPALVTGTFHTELVLFAALTALKVFGTEALDLTGLVVGP